MDISWIPEPYGSGAAAHATSHLEHRILFYFILFFSIYISILQEKKYHNPTFCGSFSTLIRVREIPETKMGIRFLLLKLGDLTLRVVHSQLH